MTYYIVAYRWPQQEQGTMEHCYGGQSEISMRSTIKLHDWIGATIIGYFKVTLKP